MIWKTFYKVNQFQIQVFLNETPFYKACYTVMSEIIATISTVCSMQVLLSFERSAAKYPMPQRHTPSSFEPSAFPLLTISALEFSIKF